MGTMMLAAGFTGDNMPGRWDDGGGADHPVMRVIMVVVFLALVAGLIWSLVALSRAKKQAGAAAGSTAGASAGATGYPTAAPSALQILDERLARGEIEPADYESRKRLLM